MFTAIGQFCHELRESGLGISTAEMLDAFMAVSAAGVDDRAALRSAMSCALCKRGRDRAMFDAVFDRRFPGKSGMGEALIWNSRGIGGGPAEGEELIVADLISSGQAAKISALSRFALTGEGTDLLVKLLSCEAGTEVSAGGFASDGLLTARLMAALSWEVSESEIRSALAGLEDRFPPEIIERFRRMAEQRLEIAARTLRETFSRPGPSAAPEAGVPLVERDLGGLKPVEIEALAATVRGLARKLRERARKRKKRFSRGRLDTKRILRTSSATDGVPLRLAFRKKVRGRPELAVLCDLSDSVRNVSALMLRFLHELHSLMGSLRSFVFVNEVGETTGLFAGRPIEEAVGRVLSGEAASLSGNSNYGHVFRSFSDRFGSSLGRRSTVLIIGDGRTNYLDPGLDGLDLIRRRVGRVVWLTPEREGSWYSGDSAMPIYRRHCDHVGTAGNVADLRTFVEALIL